MVFEVICKAVDYGWLEENLEVSGYLGNVNISLMMDVYIHNRDFEQGSGSMAICVHVLTRKQVNLQIYVYVHFVQERIKKPEREMQRDGKTTSLNNPYRREILKEERLLNNIQEVCASLPIIRKKNGI